MNDQSSSKATNPDVLKEEGWEVKRLPYIEECPPPRGFLQLCADRRFHSAIQDQFRDKAGLERPTDYWIHADAGGTATMVDERAAPDYCYDKMGVRLMGWAAHGAVCGGFPDGTRDEVILEALDKAVEKQRDRYREARHFVFWLDVTTEETLVCCKIYEPSSK